MPKWERSEVAKTTYVALVGPFCLIAQRDSFTLAGRSWKPQACDVCAPNNKHARKAVIDAARAQLAAWSAELDALEHQGGGCG